MWPVFCLRIDRDNEEIDDDTDEEDKNFGTDSNVRLLKLWKGLK